MTVATILVILTLLYIPVLFAVRARAADGVHHGTMSGGRARTLVDVSSVVLLVFALINVAIALPHAQPDGVAPAAVRIAALPIAYLAVAIAAAMRFLTIPTSANRVR